jgi:hypothetical protein
MRDAAPPGGNPTWDTMDGWSKVMALNNKGDSSVEQGIMGMAKP